MAEKKRTEEQIVARAPIVVMLGGKEYEIKPLVIKDSRPWRAKIVELLASLPKHLKATSNEPENFEFALKEVLIAMPDQVVDLFFDYAKDLDREAIEATATDDELAVAFNKIVEVAFPLAQSLPETMKRLSR